MQVKLCSDAQCWYCPRIAPHVPPNLGFFPYYTIADGNGGWVPLHERDAMMHDADERVRNLAHELFVTDKWMPENIVLAAWRRNPECDDRRVKQVAFSTNLAEQTVRALFEKLNDEHDRRTQRTRACMACHSEEIHNADLGQIVFCDHKQHTRRCLNALHQACCVPALASVPRGNWFCPEHAGTHACSPARGLTKCKAHTRRNHGRYSRGPWCEHERGGRHIRVSICDNHERARVGNALVLRFRFGLGFGFGLKF
jgi:hypothetical protein